MAKTFEVAREKVQRANAAAAAEAFNARRARGVVGNLSGQATVNTKAEAEEFFRQVYEAATEFIRKYPQCVLDESRPEGRHNRKAINDWFIAHHVSGNTFRNFKSAFEDICTSDLYLRPFLCGLPGDIDRVLKGSSLINGTTAEEYRILTSEYHGQPIDPERTMSAEAYKAAHPEGWADHKLEVAKADANFVVDQVQQFINLRPSFISSDENRDTILEAIKVSGMRITATNLCAVFDSLVQTGKLSVNPNVDLKVGGVRRVDFAGEGTGRPTGNSEERANALSWTNTHTARELEERLARDRAFKALLDS